MQLTKEIILLVALCVSCSVIWAEETNEGSTDEVTDSAGTFDNVTASLKEEAENLATNITSMKALVDASKNSIKKAALQSGVDALNTLNDNLATLQTEVNQINEKLTEDLDAKITTALTDLDTWAKAQLARASKGTTAAGIKKADARIQSVVRNYKTSLPRTTASFDKAVDNFHRQIQIAVKTYSVHARNLMDQMEACEKAAARQCESRIKTLANKVLTSKNELNRLTKLGQNVVTAGDAAAARLTLELAKLTNDKKKCENDLDIIMQRYKDENYDDLADDEDSTTTEGQ